MFKKEEITLLKNENIIMGVDIGSTKICVVICEIDKDQEIQIKSMGSSITAGIKRGKIMDIEALKKAIARAIKRAEFSAGFKPVNLFTNIPLFNVVLKNNSSLVISSEETGQISDKDKFEAIKKAKNIIKEPTQTILHGLPYCYRVDDKVVANPVGVFGTHLEVDINFILGDQNNIQALNQIFSDSGFHIKGFVYDSLSLGEVVLSADEKKSGILLIDIGGRFTKINYFENGHLALSKIIHIGGETVTSDISQCLKVTFPEAERLKIIYGNTYLSHIDSEETIQILTQQGKQYIKRRYLCQIIEARIDELVKIISQESGVVLNKANEIVLTGEGAKLAGLAKYFTMRFSKETREGLPENYRKKINNMTCSLAAGSVLYGLRVGAISYKKIPILGFFTKLFSK